MDEWKLGAKMDAVFGEDGEADMNLLAWFFGIDRQDIEGCKERGFPTPIYTLEVNTPCGECLWWFE